MSPARLVLLFFSLGLHASVAGILFFFSGNGHETEEQVYHVSLAEFAVPVAQAAPVEASPEASPPTPQEQEPSIPPPPPQPEPQPDPIAESKVISPQKKDTKPKPKAEKKKPVQEQKPQPIPQVGNAQEGQPASRLIGGLSTYKSDQVDQRPSIAKRTAPVYPTAAKRMNIEGKVLVQLVVDTSGHPQSCTVQSAEPPGYFEDAALVAANKMRFIPGKLRGQPVNTLVILPFAFQLR